MRLPGQLTHWRLLAPAVSLAVLAGVAAPMSAWAGPAPGLCHMNTSRGAVPTGFPIDACVDGSSIWLYNTSTLDLTVAATGSVSSPQTTATNPTLAVDATRLHSGTRGYCCQATRCRYLSAQARRRFASDRTRVPDFMPWR
jgi:hypothetical protein